MNVTPNASSLTVKYPAQRATSAFAFSASVNFAYEARAACKSTFACANSVAFIALISATFGKTLDSNKKFLTWSTGNAASLSAKYPAQRVTSAFAFSAFGKLLYKFLAARTLAASAEVMFATDGNARTTRINALPCVAASAVIAGRSKPTTSAVEATDGYAANNASADADVNMNFENLLFIDNSSFPIIDITILKLCCSISVLQLILTNVNKYKT